MFMTLVPCNSQLSSPCLVGTYFSAPTYILYQYTFSVRIIGFGGCGTNSFPGFLLGIVQILFIADLASPAITIPDPYHLVLPSIAFKSNLVKTQFSSMTADKSLPVNYPPNVEYVLCRLLAALSGLFSYRITMPAPMTWYKDRCNSMAQLSTLLVYESPKGELAESCPTPLAYIELSKGWI